MSSDRTIDAIREVTRASLASENISNDDAIQLIEALVEDLGPDADKLFELAQALMAKAFNAVSARQQSELARTIGEIKSDEIPEGLMHPSDDGRTHIPFSLIDGDTNDLSIDQQYLQRARVSLSDIEERDGVLGGYVTLADLSRRKGEHTGVTAIFSPTALGLRFVVDRSSLYELVRTHRLELEQLEGHGYNRKDSIRIRVSNRDARILVRVHRGTVFERQSADKIQSLVAKDEVESWVDSGTHEFTVFGMCMDQEAPGPSGQPMSLTPWACRQRIETQGELWSFTDRPSRVAEEELGDNHQQKGQCKFHLLGEKFTATSQKDAFALIFSRLSERNENFLEDMVAYYGDHRPNQIPVVTQDLSRFPKWVQRSMVEIGNRYWVHTAMSAKGKQHKVQQACEVAGIAYGDPTGLLVEF